jgi:quercetin dioxygenase-like cupin family protein
MLSLTTSYEEVELPSDPKYLGKLKELTHKIAEAPSIAKYDLEDGSQATAYNLLNIEKEVAVAQSHVPEGGVLGLHSHLENEWIIVYRGAFKCECDGNEVRIIRSGQHIFISPGIQHRITALEDTWCVAVSVPAIPEMPDGR